MVNKKEQEFFYKKLGEAIKASRSKENVTQETLAKKLGFKARVSVVNIEKGKQRIQLHTLIEVATILNVNIGELIPPITHLNLSHRIEKKIEKELQQLEDKEASASIVKDFFKLSKSKT